MNMRPMALVAVTASIWLPAGVLLGGPVPEAARGIYGTVSPNGFCAADQPVLLLNGTMAVFIAPTGGNATVTMGDADWQDGTIFLLRGDEYAILPGLDTMQRCDRPPAVLAATLGEALSVFSEMDAVRERCSGGESGGCVEALVATLDVSGDDRLSAAEIARAIRAVSVYFSYEASAAGQRAEAAEAGASVGISQAAVPLPNIYGATAAFGVLAPFVTTSLLDSYDYDGDGFLGAAELLQDREDLDLDVLMLAIGARLGEDGVRGIISGLPGLLHDLGGGLLPVMMGMR